ncbi:hypothetical protein [Paenibacillus sp. MZ03-122A]|uniref:hypothetical protein n=1 Tax=Paenibacillus sp. MZ03-122A TaxID=2962033 RepID=UPI0020B84B03|nr:hypothetical protein [Paenibacillus sp. MZ03-122A]MCP3778783.1 hypothetical protein [Paenibacillus sp. MZ03-122A]
MLDMTDQQLNVALAELTGFPADKLTPNYCNDAAASLEVQAVAINKDEEGYIRNWLLNKHGKSVMAFTAVSLRTAAEIANSSPRERAEAAYMTLSSQDLHPLREDINT